MNLVLEEKELQELGDSLRNFQHLRFINLSKNSLKDISEIVHLPYIQTLNASNNQIENVDFLASNVNALQYLQVFHTLYLIEH